jgi:hypothetical protein
MENTDELAQLLRKMGYSEVIVTKIIDWYLKDHTEIIS